MEFLNIQWKMTKTLIVRIFLKKVEGKEEKIKPNVLFMRIYKRVEFGINLNLIHGIQGGVNI